MIVKRVDLGKLPNGEDAFDVVKKWILSVIRRNYKLLTVIAIGSRAEGKHKPWSDIDIVAILETIPSHIDRWCDFVFDNTPLIEPRIYTKEEFLRALEELDLTALESMHHGLIIYDRNFYNKAKRKFNEVVRRWGLKRTDIGWVLSKVVKESEHE